MNLHAYATPFAGSDFFVAAVDGIVELVKALGVVAVSTPLPRSRQKTVLAFEGTNDDPHGVSDPWRSLFCSGIPVN